MILLQSLYLMLPAYFANMAPVIAAKIFGNKLAAPLDFGKMYKGKPLLGANKTWRGLIAGVAVGIFITYCQRWLYAVPVFKSLSLFDYSQTNIILLGFLFGFGVILGDAVKSFFKRRADLKPGDKWFPYDQLDFMGALVLVAIFYALPLPIIFIIVIVSPLLPMAANWLGYRMGLKKVAW